jgi:hypothetical protein
VKGSKIFSFIFKRRQIAEKSIHSFNQTVFVQLHKIEAFDQHRSADINFPTVKIPFVVRIQSVGAFDVGFRIFLAIPPNYFGKFVSSVNKIGRIGKDDIFRHKFIEMGTDFVQIALIPRLKHKLNDLLLKRLRFFVRQRL